MIDPKKEIEQWGPIDGKLLYASFWYLPFATGVRKDWGTPWPECIGTLDHNKITYLLQKDQIQKDGEHAILTWIWPSDKRKYLWLEYLRRIKVLKKIARDIDNFPKDIDPKSLGRMARHCYDTFQSFWNLVLVCEVANFGAPDFLKKKLLPYISKDQMPSSLQILLAPGKKSFHNQSDYELYKAVLSAKSRDDLKEKMKFHAKKWYWIDSSYLEISYITSEEFYARIRKLTKNQAQKKLSGIENHFKEITKKKKELAIQYGIPHDIMALSHALAFSIWWQDHRKGVIWWLYSKIDIISKIACDRYEIFFDDLMYYNSEEWLDLLEKKKKISNLTIQKRKKFSVHHLHATGYAYYYGDNARNILKPFIKQEIRISQDEIRGTSVSRGYAKGFVRILHSPKELYKMKKGEILVTAMTSPDFIHAMKLASAIVTDVGGLMSHAAVVSRELKKPCIVNTKVGTKVLKDGDLVEVDAESGIVKKIK